MADAGVVFVAEDRGLFRELTVAENLELGMWGKPRQQAREDLERVHVLFPRLRERMQQQADTLSGGEQQMLAIGRSLLRRPRLLLLDEPSLGLTPEMSKIVFDALVQISQAGTTILLVEQNARLALRVAHRAAILETGRIVHHRHAAGALRAPRRPRRLPGHRGRRRHRGQELPALPEEEALVTTVRSLPGLLFDQATRSGDAVAMRHKALGIWHRVTWNEYAENVRKVAASLVAFGLRHQENVAVLGENRPEWLYTSLGIMAAGGATTGIYPTSSPEQVLYLLDHSEARVIFVENEEQLEKVLPILPQTKVERMVVWDAKGLWGFKDPRVVLHEDFEKEGDALRAAEPGRLDQSAGRGRAGGHGDDHLHLRHHREPQGRHALPRQLPLHVGGAGPGLRRPAGRRRHLLPAAGPHLREPGLAPPAPAGGLHRELRGEPGHALPEPARGLARPTSPACRASGRSWPRPSSSGWPTPPG